MGTPVRLTFTVLFAGRLYRRKRVDVLLRAAAQLRGRIPGLEVRIVGHGPCSTPLRDLSRQLKLEHTVTWLGDVPRATLIEEYNHATIFCLPSVQEGFGIVLLKAMAAAKPIVASRAAAIPEVAPHAELVEPENPEALAAGIESLYRSPERRAAMAAAGARWVSQFDAPLVASVSWTRRGLTAGRQSKNYRDRLPLISSRTACETRKLVWRSRATASSKSIRPA